MPRRFKNFEIGRKGSIWVSFNKSYRNYAGELEYKFNCHIEPLICVSDQKIYFMQFKTPIYVISKFTVLADKSGKYIHAVELGRQMHPHKDPRNGFLCIGVFQGKPLNRETVKQMIFHCLLKYNETDCFHVPDISEAKIHGQIRRETNARYPKL